MKPCKAVFQRSWNGQRCNANQTSWGKGNGRKLCLENINTNQILNNAKQRFETIKVIKGNHLADGSIKWVDKCRRVCSSMDKWLLGGFLIFGKWPLKFWGVIWPKDSLVLGLNQHQGVFWPGHTPVVNVPHFITGLWFGQKTLWCWGDLAQSLLGAESALAPRSLLARSHQHQGVFWPNPKSQKLQF